MKKLLIAIIILAGIVAALFGYAAYNANSLIAKFKPDLEKIAADTLGAPVTIGNISTSLFPGVEAVIDELKVGGSGSASERFLLKNLSLHLRLLPLLKGTLEISKLSIKGPALTVVHDKEGMRVPGVPKSKGITPPSKTNAPAATSSPLAIRIEELEISDATLSYSDQISGKNYSISDLSLSSHIELGSTITIRNVAVKGRALSSGAFSATLPELTFNPASGELIAPNLAFALLGNPMVISAHGNTSSEMRG